jgi:hypothetical protein
LGTPFKLNDNLYAADEGDILRRDSGSWSTVATTSLSGYESNYRKAKVINGKAFLYNLSDPNLGVFDGSSLTVEENITGTSYGAEPRVGASIDSTLYIGTEDGSVYRRDGSGSSTKVGSLPADFDPYEDSMAGLNGSDYLYARNNTNLYRFNVTNGSWTNITNTTPTQLRSFNGQVWVASNSWVKIFEGNTFAAATYDSNELSSLSNPNISAMDEESGTVYLLGASASNVLYKTAPQKESVSVTDAQSIVLTKNGADVTLRANGNEAAKTTSFTPIKSGTAKIGASGGAPMKLRRYAQFNKVLSPSERSDLASYL